MKQATTLLLIDDDADDHEIFEMALEDADATARCLSAHRGQVALDKLMEKEFEPDIIFLDLNMPGLNGKDVLRLLKEQETLKHIPVYMYSTSAGKTDIQQCLALGAENFITKPASLAKLVELLRSILHGGNN